MQGEIVSRFGDQLSQAKPSREKFSPQCLRQEHTRTHNQCCRLLANKLHVINEKPKSRST